jgi:transcriptional regulator with PAS, ATPase and Fis domain
VFDDIFDSSVEEILTYFQGSPHGYITDKLGSSYLARWLNLSHKKFPGEKKAALVASLPALNTTPIDGFIANDLTLIRQLKKAERGSNLKVPMLILGETGTGKEMMAQYIHSVSRRRGKLIPVNCGAIAKDILEAELFGYEPGAFTGAKKEGSSGLFGAADGGTIFFDEIADLPMNAQVALLRFLDCGEIRRVGGHQIFKADVQVLTATNSDLQQAAENGRFRADLYYRINVLEILIPPIRDRTDFPHLVHHLISTISADISISYEAIERLATHSWPGNMRELRSVLTRVILSTESAHIDLKAIEKFFLDSPIDILATKKLSLHSKKIETIRRCVSEHGGNVSKAARSLGISRTTIYKHLDVVWSRVSE